MPEYAEAGADYILGTHDAELERLGHQHALWSEAAHAIWRRAGVRPGQTVLDVGCGPGYATVDLARLLGGRGRVIAIDESSRFIHHLTARKAALGLDCIEPRVGDVRKLELPEAVADFAYCRWVLCWVDDPLAVVAGIARALRPGGIVAVQDYFNYLSITLAPRSPALERVVQAVGRSQRDSGGDPDLAARLPRMFADHGIETREITPILRTARPGDALWQWPDVFFRNYVPRLVERGYLTRDDQTAFETDWALRSADPHTFFCTPPVFDVIGVKRS